MHRRPRVGFCILVVALAATSVSSLAAQGRSAMCGRSGLGVITDSAGNIGPVPVGDLRDYVIAPEDSAAGQPGGLHGVEFPALTVRSNSTTKQLYLVSSESCVTVPRGWTLSQGAEDAIFLRPDRRVLITIGWKRIGDEPGALDRYRETFLSGATNTAGNIGGSGASFVVPTGAFGYTAEVPMDSAALASGRLFIATVVRTSSRHPFLVMRVRLSGDAAEARRYLPLLGALLAEQDVVLPERPLLPET